MLSVFYHFILLDLLTFIIWNFGKLHKQILKNYDDTVKEIGVSIESANRVFVEHANSVKFLWGIHILIAYSSCFLCICNQMPSRNFRTKELLRDILYILYRSFEASVLKKIDFSESHSDFSWEFFQFRSDTI